MYSLPFISHHLFVEAVASEGRGISELAMAIAQYEAFLERSDVGRHRRIENWRTRLVEMLRAELMQRVRRNYLTEAAARELAQRIAAHECDPYTVVEEILGRFERG